MRQATPAHRSPAFWSALALLAWACAPGSAASVASTDIATSDATDADTDLAPGAPPEAAGYDCEAAAAALHAELAKATAAAGACVLASDCTVTQAKSGCEGSCGTIVAASSVGAWVKAVAAIDQTYCIDSGYKAHCTWPIPSCAKLVPVCQDGKCRNEQH